MAHLLFRWPNRSPLTGGTGGGVSLRRTALESGLIPRNTHQWASLPNRRCRTTRRSHEPANRCRITRRRSYPSAVGWVAGEAQVAGIDYSQILLLWGAGWVVPAYRTQCPRPLCHGLLMVEAGVLADRRHLQSGAGVRGTDEATPCRRCELHHNALRSTLVQNQSPGPGMPQNRDQQQRGWEANRGGMGHGGTSPGSAPNGRRSADPVPIRNPLTKVNEGRAVC